MTSFTQGENMTNSQINLIDSVLVVKASGNLAEEINNDLNLPEGKSIAQLIYDQEEKINKINKE